MRLPTDDVVQQLAATGEVKPWAITALRWLLRLTGVCLIGCLIGLALFSFQALTDNAGGMVLSAVAGGLLALLALASFLLVIALLTLMIGRVS